MRHHGQLAAASSRLARGARLMFAATAGNTAPRLSIEPLRLFLLSWDAPGYWRARMLSCCLVVVGYAIVHATLITVAYQLSYEGGSILAFWPATGLLAALLVSTPTRTWPLWILGAIGGRLGVETMLPGGVSVNIAIAYVFNNVVEASLFGLLFRRPMETAYQLGRPLYGMAAMCISALISTTAGGLLVMAIAALDIAGSPQQLWNFWRMWIVADYLAIIVFTPLTTWFLLPQIRERWLRQHSTELPYFIVTAALVVALAIYLAPLGDNITGRATRAALSVLIMSPLLWAALRFPYPVVGFSLLLFSFASIAFATHGYGPLAFMSNDLVNDMSSLQAHILTVVQATVLIAFAARERTRALDDVEQNRRFQSIVLSLSDKLIAASAGEVDVHIDEVLSDIGDFTNADRVILIRLDNERRQVASMHRWNRPTVPEQTIDVTGQPLDNFRNLVRHIEKNGHVALSDIRGGFGNLPEAVALELQPVFNVTGSTQSAIYIGLFTSGRLIGCVGCSWIRPGVWWTNESLSLLYLLGQLLANVLHRKSIELALENYQGRLRSMATEVSLSEERARRQAAIDLHDGIGQNLAVARMRIGQILQTQPEESEHWRVARELIDQALLGTRHVIADLSPAILYELGLVPAIQSLAENFKLMHDIDCEVTETGAAWVPTEDQKVMLHRNVRELLSNVARHSEAKSAQICIAWLEDELRVNVADTGIGLSAPANTESISTSGGFGLFSIRETVIQAGGTFAISSTPGSGTTVRLSVPRPQKTLVA